VNDTLSITQGEGQGSGYERVLAFVREQLLSGRLKAGDRLLPEREFAERLGVSRPVIREVLRALAAMGVVDIRHGHGTVVREPDVTHMGELFTLLLAQKADVIDDIMQARIAIERQAIRLACERASPGDISRLQGALDDIAETIADPVRGAEADFAFHHLLVQAAHSPTLTSLYGAISTLLRRSHTERRVRISGAPGIDAYLIDHHRLVLGAIVAHDAVAADRLLTQHFEIGSDLQRQALAAGGKAKR
jgi:DNA-binding FadR family transcriptional regulator